MMDRSIVVHLTLLFTSTIAKIQRKSFSQSPSNIVIYKKYMSNIYFSYIFGLYSWFLAHSSQFPWNFLSNKNGKISIVIFSLLSIPEYIKSHKV